MRADPRHDEVRWQVKDNIADVEQRQTSRHLLRRDIKDRPKVVLLVQIHRLRKANVGSNCRAHEVQDPEGWQYPSVELAVSVSISAHWDVNVVYTHAYTFSILSILIISGPTSTS
jgi:hypothetical protein